MNERIRKLAEQADRWDQEMTWSADPRYGDRPRSDLFEEKFAELIIRECEKVSLKHSHRNDDMGAIISREIKKHFGVEE